MESQADDSMAPNSLANVRQDDALHDLNPQQAIITYLQEHCHEFKDLQEVRKIGWDNPRGDAFFKRQREQADKPQQHNVDYFYNMTIGIGKDLGERTKAFQALQQSKMPTALDMGMAPGGFSATIFEQCPNARVRAVTLATADGGHAVQFHHENMKLELQDINTLAGDIGISSTALGAHPRPDSFSTKKIFSETDKFDMVICGAQVTRNQEREDWRQTREARRLHLAQLIIGLQHLEHHGTMIVVLHKPEAHQTVETLYEFSRFSKYQLFKPQRAHGKRSSFYLVAKYVDSMSPAAHQALHAWRSEWQIATVGTDHEYSSLAAKNAEISRSRLEHFGEKLVELGGPIWKIQARELRKAPFVKEKGLNQDWRVTSSS